MEERSDVVGLDGRGTSGTAHGAGRFAPSPTGELHVGNLRTALVAWLAARTSGREFLIRMEDLDRVTSSERHEQRQLDDLAAIGLDWDGDIVRQSERFDLYRGYIGQLEADGRVYPCYCTRREIREEIEAAPSAPHGLPDGAYPGTCRHLTVEERAAREADGRRPALRLRTDGERIGFVDRALGPVDGLVDDVVLARADGVPAYNLAVVVDDAIQGIDQVVRGDDLASSTPRQIFLQRLLGFGEPDYLHVALVLGEDGQRLAKRHGAVTLAELAEEGWSAADVLAALARSLGLAASSEPNTAITTDRLVDRFDPGRLPSAPATLAELQRQRT
jgi:glutamyl-tRNA synthetase